MDNSGLFSAAYVFRVEGDGTCRWTRVRFVLRRRVKRPVLFLCDARRRNNVYYWMRVHLVMGNIIPNGLCMGG